MSDTERKPPRFARQRAIEDAIMDLAPDWCEAAEILDALRAALGKRDMDAVTEEALSVYGKSFRDFLDRADDAEPRGHDD